LVLERGGQYMRIWLVTIGEPLPVREGEHDRSHRTGYFAKFLCANGHDVVWWTSTFDHFRKKHVFDADTTLYAKDGPRIVFLKGSGYTNNLSLARIRDHRQIARKFSKLAMLETQAPDIVLAALPTVELSLESVLYGKKKSVPVVLDMRDMWPDIFVDSIPFSLRPFVHLASKPMFMQAQKACSGATAITGITDEFVEWGLQRGMRERTDLDRSFPMGYTSISPPEADLRRAERFWDERRIPAHPSHITACFIGNLGREGDLETVLEAARQLKDRGARTQFVVCGSGDRSHKFTQMGARLENVIFPGWIDAASIYVLMRRSHVGLDPLSDRYDYLSTINNKAIEYLSAGLPVVLSPNRGTLYRLVNQQECGLSYDIHDAGALAEILIRLDQDRTLLHKLSRNASETFKTMFTAERVYDAMMKYLEEIVVLEKTNPKRRTHGNMAI
jgi:glycosyltransferase involved in cell wall biosynthesis